MKGLSRCLVGAGTWLMPRPWRKPRLMKVAYCALRLIERDQKKVPVRAGTRQEPAARGGCRLAKETSRRRGGHPGPLPFLSPQSLQACCFRVSPVLSLFPPGVDFIVEES